MEENGSGISRYFPLHFRVKSLICTACEIVVQIARKIPSDEDKFSEMVNKSETHYIYKILIANQDLP